MTRPGIVRADTIDLQDQSNPSAQDHTKTINGQLEFGDKLVGPHQAQEIQHIQQERHEEEHKLQRAWDAASGSPKIVGDVQNGQANGEEVNGGEADVDSASEDDMMDRISSSPSITDEDIDFDFVYALHTFVATVEGQANATKGDTMVLLDDSNSYWWLVRVVKDSSIGYLPAEHIETPTERLARLNKHRNVDLSAAMLGDNAERSKNPLKKAIKRRGAKTVQFAAPTYVEASDYDYSEDDDEVAEARAAHTAAAAANGVAQTSGVSQGPDSEDPQQTRRTSDGSLEGGLASPKVLDHAEGAPLKSRKGTTRNADSFLKDDSAETRKFTLTPNLLRDDTARSGSTSDSGKSRASSPGSDTTAPSDSPKTKKEKKQRTLSGLFKSSKKKEKEKDKVKEKGRKKDSLNGVDMERTTTDPARSTSGLLSRDATKSADGERKPAQKARKLQKQNSAATITSQVSGSGGTSAGSEELVAELEGSQVAYEAPTGLEDEIPVVKSERAVKGGKVKKARKREALDDFDDAQDAVGDPRSSSFMHGTEAVHIPLQLGEYDSSDEDDEEDEEDNGEVEEPASAGHDREATSTPPGPLEANSDSPAGRSSGRLGKDSDSESMPVSGTRSGPPQIPVSSSPSATPHVRALSPAPAPPEAITQSSTPEPMTSRPPTSPPPAPPGANKATSPVVSSAGATSPNITAPTSWNDGALRAWLDGENNDMHDMLAIIYDTSGVKPAPPNHPLLKGYLVEERSRLDGMMAELDRMHSDYLRRRQPRAQMSNPLTAS